MFLKVSFLTFDYVKIIGGWDISSITIYTSGCWTPQPIQLRIWLPSPISLFLYLWKDFWSLVESQVVEITLLLLSDPYTCKGNVSMSQSSSSSDVWLLCILSMSHSSFEEAGLRSCKMHIKV